MFTVGEHPSLSRPPSIPLTSFIIATMHTFAATGLVKSFLFRFLFYPHVFYAHYTCFRVPPYIEKLCLPPGSLHGLYVKFIFIISAVRSLYRIISLEQYFRTCSAGRIKVNNRLFLICI